MIHLAVISGMATYADLATVLSIEDAHDLIELALVRAHNTPRKPKPRGA